jgi:5-oxoprolinase (ATP-hydrolysing) subunit A
VPSIDLNADVGESFGAWPMGDDAALIPLLSSANIACGAHAGDPLTMRRTVRLALAAGVSIGAHPGYPDLAGFGRRDLAMTADELEASILAQVGALEAIVRAEGGTLAHVKVHGALYNRAAVDRAVADAVARAVAAAGGGLRLVGPPGSALLAAGAALGLPATAEGFADRAYEPDGSLRSRRLPGAVLEDPAAVAAQAVGIALGRRVRAVDGSEIEMRVDSVCLHGDTPGAVEHARAVRAGLEAAGVIIRAPGS